MSAEVVDWGVVGSLDLDAAVVCSDMSTIRSRFSPLNSLVSPVSMESVDWVVVESPPSNVTLVAHLDTPPVTNLVVPLVSRESQESHLSSVQLLPNKVRVDYDIDTLDVFPVFSVSPRSDGYQPLVSPVSSQGSLTAGSLPDEAAASRASTFGSSAMSLSITDHAANLQLLTPPLIPLPDAVLLQADPALLFKLTQTYSDFLLPRSRLPRSTRSRFFPAGAV